VTLIDFLLLAGGGFLAGVVNSVAGGGTFLSFAAMVACGLTPLEANATSAVAIAPSNLATVAAYRHEVKSHWREFIPFAIIGVIGGAIGAWLLIWLGNAGFKPLVPWLLLFATLLFAFSGPIRSLVEPWSQRSGMSVRIAAYGLMIVVSIYGGFFGAGIGFVILAALLILEGGDYHKANAIRITIAFLIQAVAAVLLIFGGLVHWPHAIVTMIAASVTGYYGVGWVKRLPEPVVRAVVVAIGAALTIVFFIKG